MGARTLLGPGDVTDEALAALVRDALGVPAVDVLACEVDVVDYDIEALTTAGRYWVRGTARHAGGVSPYAFFVKLVQSWTRTPAFQQVPEHLREVAAAGLPWRNEPTVYRSPLAALLPDGLAMPRAHAVVDLDDASACLWLEAVDADPSPWTHDTFARAARLLGRLAASRAVAPVADLGSRDVVRGYASGRVAGQILPALSSAQLWAHPLVADAFPPALRDRLLRAANLLPALLDELDRVPLGAAHGDACARNLLVPRDGSSAFVLIDFAFWCRAPLGFDLSQLLLGEVQLGERAAAELPELEQVCLTAYVQGLRDEGCDLPSEVVRRAHALTMLFAGLSAVPLEVLSGLPAPRAADVARERAAAAGFVLDLVDASTPIGEDSRQ